MSLILDDFGANRLDQTRSGLKQKTPVGDFLHNYSPQVISQSTRLQSIIVVMGD